MGSPGVELLTCDGSQQSARAWGGHDKFREESCGGQNALKPHAAEEVPRLQVVWRLEEYSLEVLYMLLHSSLSAAVRDRILG